MGLLLDSSVVVFAERQELAVSVLPDRQQEQHNVTEGVLSAVGNVCSSWRGLAHEATWGWKCQSRHGREELVWERFLFIVEGRSTRVFPAGWRSD